MGVTAVFGKFSAADVKKLQKQFNKLRDVNVEAFIESCAKELAARLIAKVTKRTPVGNYSKSSGKDGGTLRRGWTVGEIIKDNDVYKIDIINPVEYASYVEYGHRKCNGKGWVQGRFMLTISEQEIQDITPTVLENRIKKLLGEYVK